MKNFKYLLIIALTFMCHGDLDQNPTDPDLFTEVQVYSSSQEAKSALAKVYASFALTGQQGPAGQPDIDNSIIDEGFSQFTRVMYTLNECSTDTAVVGWVTQVYLIFMKCLGMLTIHGQKECILD